MGEKTLEWLIEIDGKEERFVEAAAYFEARRVGAMLVGRKEEDVSLLSNLPRAPARYSSQFLPLCNPVASKKKRGWSQAIGRFWCIGYYRKVPSTDAAHSAFLASIKKCK